MASSIAPETGPPGAMYVISTTLASVSVRDRLGANSQRAVRIRADIKATRHALIDGMSAIVVETLD
jgi:hypothetical protein